MAHGGAGLMFDATAPGSAVVNLNAENEIRFVIALGCRTVKDDQPGDTTSDNFDLSGRMLTQVYFGRPTSCLARPAPTPSITTATAEC